MPALLGEDIRTALANLEKVIEARVRAEQLLDQLTGLPNGPALNEAIRSSVEGQADFWAAFVEVDKFKSINDRFGYENADALLKKIAEMLTAMSACFPALTGAFRPHGDEFYLFGVLPDRSEETVNTVARSLELARQNIAAIRVPVQAAPPMTCTVSIGWLENSDVQPVQTERHVFAALERAVASAKRNRNCVVRYDAAMLNVQWLSWRSDCPTCGCKFSLDVSAAENRNGERLRCPNCSGQLERPIVPGIVQVAQPERV